MLPVGAVVQYGGSYREIIEPLPVVYNPRQDRLIPYPLPNGGVIYYYTRDLYQDGQVIKSKEQPTFFSILSDIRSLAELRIASADPGSTDELQTLEGQIQQQVADFFDERENSDYAMVTVLVNNFLAAQTIKTAPQIESDDFNETLADNDIRKNTAFHKLGFDEIGMDVEGNFPAEALFTMIFPNPRMKIEAIQLQDNTDDSAPIFTGRIFAVSPPKSGRREMLLNSHDGVRTIRLDHLRLDTFQILDPRDIDDRVVVICQTSNPRYAVSFSCRIKFDLQPDTLEV